MAILNNLHIAKQQTGALGLLFVRNANKNASSTASYSTSRNDPDAPKQLKTTNLTSMKRGTGGRSSFNGMIVSIFGCTGFMGPYVANRFGKIGSQMVCCYRGDIYPTMRLRPSGDLGQVLFHFYHLNDEESIRKAVKHSNVVVNLVGRSWETKNFKFNDVHVDGARRIAKVCREMGVERLIHLSAMNVSPNPTPIVYKEGSKFLKSKYYGELAVLEEFPDATIIRPSEIYGQADHFFYYYTHIMRRQLHSVPLWHKGEKTIKAPVYGGDVAQAIVNAAKDPDTAGKIYQGVGPRQYQLGELIDWIYRVVRRTPEDWGYVRYDMRYDPTFFLKVWLNDKITLSHYIGDLHKERIEREHVSDVIEDAIPTLEDLGVELTYIEDLGPWLLKPYTTYAYYDPEPGEFSSVGLPKFIDPEQEKRGRI